MKILDIYKDYQIPDNLQLHQLRVAGVAKLTFDNWLSEKPDINLITSVCLLHDMGNIIKFDFEKFPQLVEGDIEHWRLFRSSLSRSMATAQITGRLKYWKNSE
jgi:hypothetical protein